jgi:hypothetical protein
MHLPARPTCAGKGAWKGVHRSQSGDPFTARGDPGVAFDEAWEDAEAEEKHAQVV